MDGADEPRVGRIVAKRDPNLGDQVDEIFFDHERVWPERILERRLRERFRPVDDQQFEQLIRLG